MYIGLVPARGAWIAALCLLAVVAAGQGLSTRFGWVQIHDVPIGSNAVIRLGSNQLFSVCNTSDEDITIRVTPIPADKNCANRQHEPLPDLKWVTVNPSIISLPAHSTGRTEVVITVPDQAEWANRRFEFRLRSQSVGRRVGIALISRVQFNTVPGKEKHMESSGSDKRHE